MLLSGSCSCPIILLLVFSILLSGCSLVALVTQNHAVTIIVFFIVIQTFHSYKHHRTNKLGIQKKDHSDKKKTTTYIVQCVCVYCDIEVLHWFHRGSVDHLQDWLLDLELPYLPEEEQLLLALGENQIVIDGSANVFKSPMRSIVWPFCSRVRALCWFIKDEKIEGVGITYRATLCHVCVHVSVRVHVCVLSGLEPRGSGNVGKELK